MALVLKKAQRKKVKLKIGMAAPAGGGKTASSLILAYGLLKGEHPNWSDEEIWEKIAIVDTENGSGELYANTKIGTTTIGMYNAISLDPPYDAQKYIEAIEACKEAGMEVCIVDSLSHAWNGQGGLLEKQANIAKRTGNSYTAWRDVSPLYQKLIDCVLQIDMHMICTMRSKIEYVQEKDDRGKTSVRRKGMAPQIRDGAEYEFSVYIEIDADHQAFASKDRTGVLDGDYFVITPAIGVKLAKWLDGGIELTEKPKVILEKVTPAVTEDKPATLPELISSIDSLAKSLPDMGIQKAAIVDVIRGVTGGTANYKNITDITVAQDVLKALKQMKE